MAKTMQVLNICDRGKQFVCVKHLDTNRNPYKLYRKWYDMGWHQRKVVEYQDFESVLWHLLQNEYHPGANVRL